MLKNALSLFILSVIILVVFLPSYSTMQDLKQKNEEYAKRIVDLQAKNKSLEEEKHRMLTDQDYVEKVGREKMGLIRDGETMYKFVEGKPLFIKEGERVVVNTETGEYVERA